MNAVAPANKRIFTTAPKLTEMLVSMITHPLLSRVGGLITPYARAYASVLFCDAPWLGVWFATLTWLAPHTGFPGLLGLLFADAWARMLGLSKPGEPHLVNGLLTGLFLSVLIHAWNAQALAWIACAALLSTLLSHWLSTLLWQNGKLPVLSLPFTLATWAILLAQSDRAVSLASMIKMANAPVFTTPGLDNFFIALGWLFLMPVASTGALLFLGLIAVSRYLALLAVGGYLAGLIGFHLFNPLGGYAIGFNYMLTAMALGGIFSTPGRSSLLFALAGSVLSGWAAVALDGILHGMALPLLTAPFLLTVYLGLGALGSRNGKHALSLNLEQPTAPEIAYERAQLAAARGVIADSQALSLPFYGEWRVSQGFDGPYTHRDSWRHALDFHIVENGCSHSGDGQHVSDYYCFGAPILAPAAAQVVSLRADLPDMPPGSVDIVNNWGNFLLLRMDNGFYVKLAHLKQGSVTVKIGEWVNAGQQVAACGSSGRAPEPHLHLHVQTGAPLGSPTIAFHFGYVLARGDEQAARNFYLCKKPLEGERVSAAPVNEFLAAAMQLPLGRRYDYRLKTPKNVGNEKQRSFLCVELTLLGQFRLTSSTGASAAFEKTPAVVGFYDRQGKQPDPLLDLWLLALGLTPLSNSAESWNDQPPLRLLPLQASQRLLTALLKPLGSHCDSQYHRCWDETAYVWRQEGRHRIRLAPGIEWQAHTLALINPESGVKRLQLDWMGRSWEAVLENSGWVGAKN